MRARDGRSYRRLAHFSRRKLQAMSGETDWGKNTESMACVKLSLIFNVQQCPSHATDTHGARRKMSSRPCPLFTLDPHHPQYCDTFEGHQYGRGIHTDF